MLWEAPEKVKIEEDVPQPSRNYARGAHYWEIVSGRMEVGHSVLITLDADDEELKRKAVMSYTRGVLRRVRPDWAFTVKTINENAFRVWRIA